MGGMGGTRKLSNLWSLWSAYRRNVYINFSWTTSIAKFFCLFVFFSSPWRLMCTSVYVFSNWWNSLDPFLCLQLSFFVFLFSCFFGTVSLFWSSLQNEVLCFNFQMEWSEGYMLWSYCTRYETWSYIDLLGSWCLTYIVLGSSTSITIFWGVVFLGVFQWATYHRRVLNGNVGIAVLARGYNVLAHNSWGRRMRRMVVCYVNHIARHETWVSYSSNGKLMWNLHSVGLFYLNC